LRKISLKNILAITLVAVIMGSTACGNKVITEETKVEADAETVAESEAIETEAAKETEAAVEAEVDDGKADSVIMCDMYTGDENQPEATAMAIKDGIITFVGDAKDVAPFIGDDTYIAVLNHGEFITPGLIDGHTHVTEYIIAAYNNLCRIPDGSSAQECVEIIRQFIIDNPDEVFITVNGWNNSAFGDIGPTADLLDAIDTDKPILAYSADGHSCWANTKLMTLAGLTKDTPDPEGGAIMRYADGTPSGCVKDTANVILEKVKPEKTREVLVDGIMGAENLNAREGYVARFQAGDNETSNLLKTPVIDTCEEMDRAGKLNTYIQASFQVSNTEDALEMVDKAIELRDKTKGGNYEVATVKIFMDGIIENQGANLSEPYSDDPTGTNYGTTRWTGEESLVRLGHVIAKANENGMNVHFHTMGDQAVSDALHAIELAAEEIGIEKVQEARNALVHLALVKNTDFEKFAKYNVVAVLNPWCVKDPSFFEQQIQYLGEKRANDQYPMKSFLDNGVHIAFGTDLGASFTYNSIECFHTLCTRKYKSGDPSTVLKESETLSRQETIDAMTKGAAYQLHKEDEFGTITVGKQANITVFDKNILTCDEENIMGTKVLGCIYQGKLLQFIPFN